MNKLGIYIHWPYCTHICPYCDFNIYRARGRDENAMIDAIKSELKSWAGNTGKRALTSLYFGGGTPSLITPHNIAQLIEICDELWGFDKNPEIVLEANPNDGEIEKFQDFAKAGVERLSLGVQSFKDDGLKALGRFHDVKTSIKATEIAQKYFNRVSLDLIYARQNQSLSDWEFELQSACELGVNHISPYQLTIEPNTSFDRKVKRGAIIMPDDDKSLSFYQLTQDYLNSQGFSAYEISNHARGVENQSRHNLLYWQSQDWIGIGAGAHGRLGGPQNRRAILNLKKPDEYIEAINKTGFAIFEDEIITADEVNEEFWLMGLRLLDGVEYNPTINKLNQAKLQEMLELGYVKTSQNRIALTMKGRPLSNAIIASLLS